MYLDKAIQTMFGRKLRINSPDIPLSSRNILNYLGKAANDDSGVSVTRQTAMGIPAFWSACRIFSESVARLPLMVYRETQQGKKPFPSHPAHRLLYQQSNQYNTAFEFRRALTLDAVIEGNGYAYIYRAGSGAPAQLRRLDPAVTYPVLEERFNDAGIPTESRLWYITTWQFDTQNAAANMASRQSKQIRIPAEDVIHIKGIGPDEWCGYSALEVLATSIGMSIAHQKYSAVFFKNNAMPNMVITLPFQLKGDAVERFRASWAAVHEGSSNQHKVAILENGADVKPISIDPEKAQLIQSMEHDRTNIAIMFGLPPYFLGVDVSTSYNSLEATKQNFLTFGLEGTLVNWEQQSSLRLLSEAEKMSGNVTISHNREQMERPDRKTEVETMTMLVNNGVQTVDEIRAKDNLPPLPDQLGALPRMPLNIAFADQVRELAEAEDDPHEELPEPDEQQESDIEESSSGPNQRERVMVRKACEKMLGRLSKLAQAKAVKPGKFMDWLDELATQDNVRHNVDPFDVYPTAEPVISDFLNFLRDELLDMSGTVHEGQLLRSVEQIMSRHEQESPAMLVERLLKE